MWQRFTDTARAAIFYAQQEAQRRGCNSVSTEDVLLGLLMVQDGVIAHLISSANTTAEKLRAVVLRRLPQRAPITSQEMTLTPRAKRVIDLAYDIARNRGDNFIAPYHLLIGSVREGAGMAAEVLALFGITMDFIREHVVLTDSLPVQQPHPGRGRKADIKRLDAEILAMGKRITELESKLAAIKEAA